MSPNPIPINQAKPSDEPWWKFDSTVYLLLGGAILLGGGLLPASGIDSFFGGLFNLLDFRIWPWWYFLMLLAVVAFSVRWFFLYQKKVNDDFDPVSLEEAKWFMRLSGTLTGIFAILVILHQTGMIRRAYTTLNYMFGYGAFSIWALLIFAVIFTAIGVVVALAWKWMTSIQID